MNKEQKEILKLKLENLSYINKSEYYSKLNKKLIAENSIANAEVETLTKRIELCKIFLDKYSQKQVNGKQGFKNYNGIDIVRSILNGTSNFAKLEGLKEYEEVEVLE